MTVNSSHNGPVTRKIFPFYDVIMNKLFWVIITSWQGDSLYITSQLSGIHLLQWYPPQEYNSPRFCQCDEWCAFGVAILLYIDKGVPVAHRPTKRSPSIHFLSGLVRNEGWKNKSKLWLSAGWLLTWVVGIRREQASQTLVFSFCSQPEVYAAFPLRYSFNTNKVAFCELQSHLVRKRVIRGQEI